jgi:uncharacterized protein YndB with AHSA1/START domain
MSEAIEVSTTLPASPQTVYQAWLNSQAHGAFSGSPAQIDPRVGGGFTAWDGYIQGSTLELEPYRRIRQAWRTTEFPEGSPDSDLEILLDPVPEGTLITLVHTQIPDNQGEEYRQGWLEYYFQPMQEYFAKK